MPRLGGVNLVGVLLAAIAIYFVGFLWFGVLFHDIWQAANGYSLEQLEASFDPLIVFGGGFLIPLILAFGIGWLLKKTGTTGLGPSIAFGAMLAILFAAPVLGYSFVYNIIHSPTDLLLDISHSFVGFVVGAAVLSFFD
ncbi:MAG: DUF1761 domain-containing protein [Hyphomonadaceae bacterium]